MCVISALDALSSTDVITVFVIIAGLKSKKI
jgi:hypothetical protein